MFMSVDNKFIVFRQNGADGLSAARRAEEMQHA